MHVVVVLLHGIDGRCNQVTASLFALQCCDLVKEDGGRRMRSCHECQNRVIGMYCVIKRLIHHQGAPYSPLVLSRESRKN